MSCLKLESVTGQLTRHACVSGQYMLCACTVVVHFVEKTVLFCFVLFLFFHENI